MAESTDDTDRSDGLKNPMRFSIRNRIISIEEKLRHPDFDEKKVTEIEIQDGQLYVHWEWAVDAVDDGAPTAKGESIPSSVNPDAPPNRPVDKESD